MDFGRGFDSRRLHHISSAAVAFEVLRRAQDFACGCNMGDRNHISAEEADRFRKDYS